MAYPLRYLHAAKQTTEHLEFDVLARVRRYLDCSLNEPLEYVADRTTGTENSHTDRGHEM